MKRAVLAAAAAAAGISAWAGMAGADPRPSLSQPALSPDGTEIAFVSGGDIWTAPASGGTARLLVSNPATESRPLYSPDGSKLAFQSTRDGPNNIYILTLATGQVTRLTFADAGEALDGWSADGKWIYFTSSKNDVQRQGDIFRVAATGGTPLEVSREQYLNEFESAPSPDGKTIALIAKGLSSSQWWRHGHAHIDETEVWLKPVDGDAYRRLLPADAKHAWPMWARDGSALYLMSDEDGNENLWRLPLGGGVGAGVGGVGGGRPIEVTRFKDGRLLWPSIGSGDAIVFERGFSIWKYDPVTGQAAQVPITLRGVPAGAGDRRLDETSFQQMAASPDGKKVAFIAHGQVFAASANDGGAAQRLTRGAGSEGQIAWSPDSRRIAYVSEEGVESVVSEYDFATGQERRLTPAKGAYEAPVYSPDGQRLAYFHNGRELHVVDRAGPLGSGGRDRIVFEGALSSDAPAWSPDSRWIAFGVGDHRSFSNLDVVEAAGGEPHPITFLGNGEIGGVAWSPDGRYVLMSTDQRSEPPSIVRVDLTPHVPKFREDVFQDLFRQTEQPDRPANPPAQSTSGTPPKTAGAGEDKPAGSDAAKGGDDARAAKAAKPAKSVEIVFEGIRQRIAVLPLGLSAEDPHISPDGKTLVFRATVAGQGNLYSYDLDELAKEPPTPRQLTSTRKTKIDIAFTPDSKAIFYLEDGVVTSTPLEDPRAEPVAINAELTVDFDAEKLAVFDEAWSTLNLRFYDPTFHGRDWAGLRAQWLPYIEGTRTPDELRRDINLMIGELNASHSGINGPKPPEGRVGELGLRFERAPYEAGKGLVVREVIALGPADIAGIKPGDTLLAVDGQALAPGVNLDSLLLDQIDKRTVLRIAPPGAPRGASGRASGRDVVVRPVSAATAAGLAYRQWVEGRRAYVDKISGGRLGYVHIADMSDASLAQLYLDLDAQNQGKQGVVIDLRNNNGGYVNGYALDVFTRRNYLMMTPRGRFAVPSRQALGQRALGLPTVLVVNEFSLSDAEDFTQGYRALGLGKVVGVPTAGWIIYTGARELIDGSTVRVPFIRIQTPEGEDLEGHPRPVDVMVERPLGETETGRDAQLEAAVRVLLGEGDKAK